MFSLLRANVATTCADAVSLSMTNVCHHTNMSTYKRGLDVLKYITAPWGCAHLKTTQLIFNLRRVFLIHIAYDARSIPETVG